MNFITNFPPSDSYDSILVVVDYLMKMIHFIPCAKTITSEITTKLFLDHVFRYHNLPKDIIFDHGLQFAFKFWKQLFKVLGVKVKLSSSFHPPNGWLNNIGQSSFRIGQASCVVVD